MTASPPAPRTSRGWWVALALVTLVFLLVNQSYYRNDKRPPGQDESWYLETGLYMYQAMVDGDWGRFVYHYRTAFRVKAPLISVLLPPIFLAVGPSYKAALLVNSVFLVVASVCLFALARRLFSPSVGLAAVVFYQTMPLALGLSRSLMTEYGLVALVLAALYFLLASEGFSRGWANAALGVVLGLGLLMKVIYPAFVAGPLLVAWMRHRPPLRRLAAVAAPAVAIAATWYVFNLGAVIEFAWSNAFGEIATGYGTSTAAKRFLRAIREGPSMYYAVTLAALAPAALAMAARGGRLRERLSSHSSLLLLAWVLPPLLPLALGQNLAIRFVAPLLPAAALALAVCIEGLSSRPAVRAILFALVACLPLRQYAELSLPGSRRLGVAHAPDAEGHWHQQRVLEALQLRNPPGAAPRYVIIGVEHPYFNANLFSYLSTYHRYNWRFTSLGYAETSWQRAVERLHRLDAHYIVMTTGFSKEDLSPFLNEINRDIQALLDRGELPFRLLAKVRLYGDLEALIYEKEAPWTSYTPGAPFPPPAHPMTVDFFGGIRFLGYDWKRLDASRGEISYYWTAPHRVDEDYRIHVVFRRGSRELLRQDFFLAGGRRPFFDWEAGEVVRQNMTVALAEEPGAPLEARLWLSPWGAGPPQQVAFPKELIHESVVPLRLEP